MKMRMRLQKWKAEGRKGREGIRQTDVFFKDVIVETYLLKKKKTCGMQSESIYHILSKNESRGPGRYIHTSPVSHFCVCASHGRCPKVSVCSHVPITRI